MITPLILGNPERAVLQQMVAHAEAHRINIDDMRRRIKHPSKPIGDEPGYSCEIPTCFRCVYSIEEHPKGWARHLSVSVMKKDRAPSPIAVNEIMAAIGFKSRLVPEISGSLLVWLERGEFSAVNVLEFL